MTLSDEVLADLIYARVLAGKETVLTPETAKVFVQMLHARVEERLRRPNQRERDLVNRVQAFDPETDELVATLALATSLQAADAAFHVLIEDTQYSRLRLSRGAQIFRQHGYPPGWRRPDLEPRSQEEK
jgi:hypothetical protein